MFFSKKKDEYLDRNTGKVYPDNDFGRLQQSHDKLYRDFHRTQARLEKLDFVYHSTLDSQDKLNTLFRLLDIKEEDTCFKGLVLGDKKEGFNGR